MNWILLIVVGILIIYAFNGRRRGFIRTVFALFSTIIALTLTVWVSPIISKEFQKNEKVMGFVSDKVSNVLDFSKAGQEDEEQTSFIEGLHLPKSVKKSLIKNNTTENYVSMAVDNFNGYISNSISRIIINAAVFIALMLIITIALAIICEMLNIISKLPIINGINKSAGLLAGLLQGIVIVWIGCIVLTMFSGTSFGQYAFKQINDNQFLTIIYENNLFLQIVTDLSKTLF